MKRNITVLILLALLLALLVLPIQAEEGLSHVTDEAAILTEEETLQLEELCRSVSEDYSVGVYIVTVDDYAVYGSDVYEVTCDVYHEYTMGKGSERNGIMLLLSMDSRDFATFVYGADAEYAFSDYALLLLEDAFLPHFGEDDWYEGFRAYALTCQDYLESAAAGEPVESGDGILYVIVIGVSFLIALIVVSILRAGMKNVRTKYEADAYVSRDLALTQRRDQFTHKTTTRRKIETNSSSGSKSHSGGGGHGRSGKF
ncbi:MAG: TPM domain-containing protein [Oscillospiraceae bacterium]|nr:TPM domain-containing protein [Oscillospiraceae bacterium]